MGWPQGWSQLLQRGIKEAWSVQKVVKSSKQQDKTNKDHSGPKILWLVYRIHPQNSKSVVPSSGLNPKKQKYRNKIGKKSELFLPSPCKPLCDWSDFCGCVYMENSPNYSTSIRRFFTQDVYFWGTEEVHIETLSLIGFGMMQWKNENIFQITSHDFFLLQTCKPVTVSPQFHNCCFYCTVKNHTRQNIIKFSAAGLCVDSSPSVWPCWFANLWTKVVCFSPELFKGLMWDSIRVT